MDLACPKCNKVYRDQTRCPSCGAMLTRDWSGKAAIIKVEDSKVAREMKINAKGIYALKI